MLRVAIAICVVACAGSAQAGLDDELPPEAYLDPIDQLIARTGEGLPGRPFPCAREVTDGEVEYIESIPTDRCVRMLPAQRWRGLWRNEFEGSRLCPAPAHECSFHTSGDRVWLGFAKKPLDDKTETYGGLYEVEFIGRRTMYKGPYGHMGVSDHEVIADHLISMRLVEPPPPPPTQAEMEAEWKRCEAAGNCISWDEVRELQKRKD